jgi:hypothetical protein
MAGNVYLYVLRAHCYWMCDISFDINAGDSNLVIVCRSHCEAVNLLTDFMKLLYLAIIRIY